MARPADSHEPQSTLSKAISGFPMRSIGPALMGGRIADLAIHPSKPSTWLIAVGSGGVWRTHNCGITWKPVFDKEASYSTGCIRIDPSHPEIIWVGSGEAVSGRHVAWGDGVYRSSDGGDSWTNMGLKGSEHISDILIDPRNSDVVYVAAEGPLWSSGGERGLFKTIDGGTSWDLILEVDDDTGVSSAVFAPGDPDTIYAASYQRRRRVWSFIGGGPGSGIHVSNDAGASFTPITEGLPKGEMGRIGLAVTPADPQRVYATIEAVEEKEKGFYLSTNRGRSWERRNEYISGGTGPHYYQEIFASPTDRDRVYQVDVFLHVTSDAGKTFRNMEDGKNKHSDNHVVWIDPNDGDHLIVGCDAGLYETFDHGDAWRHVSNLPISQFYRVAVDNAVPFPNVLGGAQDLGTLYGPTRTQHLDGVRNQDWFVPLGADGYHVAFDPDDQHISYLEWQVGNAMRHDRRTMELVDIQPQPGADDPAERWNWDTPIVVSPHRSNRIYMTSQRVWRSEDRGDSWAAISPDLTTDRNRYELATSDRVVSVDSLYDHEAMSHYCTITAFAESAAVEGLLYAGTDDGQIQVSEDGGSNWRRAARPEGLSEVAFINDIEPSRHDDDVVIVAADDHKSGDYAPHLFESSDRGRTWRSIAGDLPAGSIVWSIEQDHVEPDLLFAGAEHGVHVSVDGGAAWHRLDTPTIAFRDLAIQRRDNDLVAASFGRGIYILDDYTALRGLGAGNDLDGATLFPVRDAWWYVPYQPMQAVGQPTLGTTAFHTPNPEFGACFTYHLASDVQTAKESRRRAERALGDMEKIEFPGWDRLTAEHLESDSVVLLVIRDAEGEAVRTIPAAVEAGLHRASWDLRRPAPDPVTLEEPTFKPPWASDPQGQLVEPGQYRVELVQIVEGQANVLTEPQSFSVMPTPAVVSETGDDPFRRACNDLARRVAGAAKNIESARARVRHLRAGITAAPAALTSLGDLDVLHRQLERVAVEILGDPVREKLAEPSSPSIKQSADRIAGHHRSVTGSPTNTQRQVLEVTSQRFGGQNDELARVIGDLARLAADLDAAGGSWTPP